MRSVLLEIDRLNGDTTWHRGRVKASKDDLIAVLVPELGRAYALRSKQRRRLQHPLLPFIRRPGWRVREECAWSTELATVRTKGAEPENHVNGGAEPNWDDLLSGAPMHDLSVEDADSSMLAALLDDKAVGDYIKSKMFIPLVQAAIIVAAGAAVLALIAAWLGYQAASQDLQATLALHRAFEAWAQQHAASGLNQFTVVP